MATLYGSIGGSLSSQGKAHHLGPDQGFFGQGRGACPL